MTSTKSSKILITGVAGFIGFHIASHLLAEGREIIGVDNLNDYYDPRLKKARLAGLEKYSCFEFRRADICEIKVLTEIFENDSIREIIHLAAQAGVRYSLENPRVYIDSNVTGFLNVLESCREFGIDHLVYASSSSVYGLNEKYPFHENDPDDCPTSLYAATKKSNELMAHVYSHLFGIPATGLRFFSVYGPWGRPDMAVFKFTKAIFEGEPIDVYNEGMMKRDFTYIDDVVDAVAKILAVPPGTGMANGLSVSSPTRVAHRIYNIGNNKPTGLLELITIIEAAIGRKAIKKYFPMQDGDVPETYASIDLINKKIGFRPKMPLEEGIGHFVDWYKNTLMRLQNS